MVDLFVENHGYILVWVGFPMHDPARTVVPAAKAGTASHYLDHISIHWSEDQLSQGPPGMAIRTGAQRWPLPSQGSWVGMKIVLKDCGFAQPSMISA